MCEEFVCGSHPRKPRQMNLRRHRPANGSYPFSSFTMFVYLWSCEAIAADAKKPDEEDDEDMPLVAAEVLLYMFFQTGHIPSINFMPMLFSAYWMVSLSSGQASISLLQEAGPSQAALQQACGSMMSIVTFHDSSVLVIGNFVCVWMVSLCSGHAIISLLQEGKWWPYGSLLRLMKGIPTSWESSQQKLDVLLLCCQLLNCKATMTSSILVALKHPCNSGTHHFKENHLKKRRETIPQKIVLCGFLSRRLPKSKVNGLTNIYIIVSTCGKKYIWIRGTPPCWVHS